MDIIGKSFILITSGSVKGLNNWTSLAFVYNPEIAFYLFFSFFAHRINAVSNAQIRGETYGTGCIGQTGINSHLSNPSNQRASVGIQVLWHKNFQNFLLLKLCEFFRHPPI